MAAGAGGDPPAEGREPERLREVPQGVAAGPQLVLEVGSEHAGLYAGRPGHVVDLQHPVETVERDHHGRAQVVVGGDAPHHRRSPAVGDCHVPVGVTPIKGGLHLGLVAGVGHHVGRVAEIEVEGPDPLGEVSAVGVAGPVIDCRRAPAGHRVGDRDPGSSQFGVVQRGHGPGGDLGAVAGGELGGQRGPVGVAGLLRLQAPSPKRLAISQCRSSGVAVCPCRRLEWS